MTCPIPRSVSLAIRAFSGSHPPRPHNVTAVLDVQSKRANQPRQPAKLKTARSGMENGNGRPSSMALSRGDVSPFVSQWEQALHSPRGVGPTNIAVTGDNLSACLLVVALTLGRDGVFDRFGAPHPDLHLHARPEPVNDRHGGEDTIRNLKHAKRWQRHMHGSEVDEIDLDRGAAMFPTGNLR